MKTPTLITHKKPTSVSLVEEALTEAVQRLDSENAQDLTALTELKELTYKLGEFPAGQFLLMNQGGWNGYWTHKIISCSDEFQPYVNEVERFLMEDAPTVKATRERFQIFQNILQTSLQNGARIGSVPCGLMNDLLSLDYSEATNIKLFGVDLDSESLELGRRHANSQKRLGDASYKFFQQDAWELCFPEPLDILTSNGLNIYVADDQRVVDLYKSFYKSLRPKTGMLLTSFLTPPPEPNTKCEWKLEALDLEALNHQRKIFIDILRSTWAKFRTSEKTTAQLEAAGFSEITIDHGSTGMFPTVRAYRRH